MATLDPIATNEGLPADPIQSGAGKRFLLDPIQETAWRAGVVVRGFTIKVDGDTVTAVIKVIDPKGKPKVAFVTAHSYAVVMEVWFQALTTTAVSLKWHDDRFA